MFDLEGIIAAMVTPMTEDEEVDLDKVRQLVNNYIDRGIDGLFCLSTNGEFYSLTREEKLLVTETVVDECDNRVPVIAGTGGITTKGVIELTEQIKKKGVDAVSVITPYFITPNEEEIYNHYRQIAESVNFPIILYNIPGRTGVSLAPKTVEELSKIDEIVGVKDSSGDFDNILRYLERTNDDFMVYSGNDSLVLWTLQAGGNGAISGMANIFPELMKSIYDYWSKGEMEKAKERQFKIRPIRNALKLNTFPSIVKAAMRLNGVDVGPPRSPVSFPDDSVMKRLEKVLENYNE